MTLTPHLATVIRLAELIAELPHANPKALDRVRVVTTRPDSSCEQRGIWAWRELDWLPLYVHFGRTRNWLSANVRSLSPETLLSLLEVDFGFEVQVERAA